MQVTLATDTMWLLLPCLAIVTVYGIFTALLKWQVGDNLFGEIGFLYLGFVVAYTVLPAYVFVVGATRPGDLLGLLWVTPPAVGIHLWRHVLFASAVAAAYLVVRGRVVVPLVSIEDPRGKDGATVALLVALTSLFILCIVLMSAPVHSYLDHYVRYDHLPWLSRKFVSVCLRLNFGFYSALLVFLFLNYKKYKRLIPIVVLIICVHEIVYSFGARIQALVVLLEALCLYNCIVRTISLKKGLVAFAAIAAVFSVVELLREFGFDLTSTRAEVSERGLRVAYEFGAVFFPGFHLYLERATGTLPPREWPMFFSDFISAFTLAEFTRWNPMRWYAANYYPGAIVAPFTLGPIADSAVWGGEIDLFFRGLVNGAFFGWLVRWFVRHKASWWAVTIYVYCCATCIVTLKYSVFYHLTPLVKTLLPTLIIVAVVRKFLPSSRTSTSHSSRRQVLRCEAER